MMFDDYMWLYYVILASTAPLLDDYTWLYYVILPFFILFQWNYTGIVIIHAGRQSQYLPIIMAMGFFCSFFDCSIEHGCQWWTKWWLVSAELGLCSRLGFGMFFLGGHCTARPALYSMVIQSLSTLEIEFETKKAPNSSTSRKNPRLFVGHLTVGGCIFRDESSGVQTSTKGSERWRRLRVRSRSLWRGDTLKSLRLWQEIYSYPGKLT